MLSEEIAKLKEIFEASYESPLIQQIIKGHRIHLSCYSPEISATVNRRERMSDLIKALPRF
jgi:hypothetical protein